LVDRKDLFKISNLALGRKQKCKESA